MSIELRIAIIVFAVCAGPSTLRAQDKVPLGEPEPSARRADDKSAGIPNELASLPDGVLLVKNNPDGSFRSLVVKSTVEIDDALGSEKGVRSARKDADIQCRGALTRWLQDNCAFVEASNRSTTFVTKGESAKDAAGNTIKIRRQEATEIKANTESHVSASAATLRGLEVLYNQVSEDKSPRYVLVLGLSQKNIDQAAKVRDALSSDNAGPSAPSHHAGPATGPSDREHAGSDDRPPAETKTNPNAKGYFDD